MAFGVCVCVGYKEKKNHNHLQLEPLMFWFPQYACLLCHVYIFISCVLHVPLVLSWLIIPNCVPTCSRSSHYPIFVFKPWVFLCSLLCPHHLPTACVSLCLSELCKSAGSSPEFQQIKADVKSCSQSCTGDLYLPACHSEFVTMTSFCLHRNQCKILHSTLSSCLVA